jgi:GT2 family glycosyltransferase
MVALAEAEPGLGAVGAVLYEMERPERIQAWGGGEVSLLWGQIRLLTAPDRLSRLSYISGASLLLRGAALRSVGLLDEGFFIYGEDVDLGLRMRRAGWRLGVASAARVWHRGGSSWGKDHTTADEHFAAYNTRLWRKHSPIPLLAVAGYTLFWTLEYSLRRRWASLAALWRGVRRGWRLPLEEDHG